MLHFGDSVYEVRLRKDALVEKKEDRLARLAAAGVVARRRSAWAEGNRRLMTWIGGLMVDWGCELQSRYASEPSSTLRLDGPSRESILGSFFKTAPTSHDRGMWGLFLLDGHPGSRRRVRIW